MKRVREKHIVAQSSRPPTCSFCCINLVGADKVSVTSVLVECKSDVICRKDNTEKRPLIPVSRRFFLNCLFLFFRGNKLEYM